MKYLISGNTYQIKEDLKAHGCIWNPEKKLWETPWLEKDELSFKRLQSLTLACDASMIPFKLDGKEKIIQEILAKGRKE